ncbi:conserved hypothetical protein [Ricinus communis]|uniref:Uncharacterized protein n=1 Tax=Ricinus communis TaxID=3988 RepID=B9TDQ1_RICCO|nr:conserved hypothetical protein [Ricinus communis]
MRAASLTNPRVPVTRVENQRRAIEANGLFQMRDRRVKALDRVGADAPGQCLFRGSLFLLAQSVHLNPVGYRGADILDRHQDISRL